MHNALIKSGESLSTPVSLAAIAASLDPWRDSYER